MKDLILITAYTPDSERVELIKELLKTIDRDSFDVMISSHSSVSDEVVKSCDYFIFQKKNTLLTDIDHKIKFWFGNGSFEIFTTEFKNYNHLIAAGSLILNGLSAAKNFGYEKVHFLEYDSLILDDEEFKQNSKILDEHSIVWYEHPDLKNTVFSLISFNVKKIKHGWFDLSDEIFYSFLEKSEDNILESFNLKMIKEEHAFCKHASSLSEKIQTCRYTSDEEDWITVVSDGNNFVLFDFNHTGINDISVIINDDTVKVFSNHNKGTWMTRTLGRTEEINKIKIFLNDALIRSYDFSIIDKEKYIKKNWIKNK